jgi:hypothetical protein
MRGLPRQIMCHGSQRMDTDYETTQISRKPVRRQKPSSKGAFASYAAPISERVDNPKQDNRAEEGRQKRPEDALATGAKEAQNDTSEQAVDDARHDAAQDTQFVPLDQAISQRTGQATNHNPDHPCPQRSKDAGQDKAEIISPDFLSVFLKNSCEGGVVEGISMRLTLHILPGQA